MPISCFAICLLFGVVEQAQTNFTMSHILDRQIICVYLDVYQKVEHQADKSILHMEKNLSNMASVPLKLSIWTG